MYFAQIISEPQSCLVNLTADFIISCLHFLLMCMDILDDDSILNITQQDVRYYIVVLIINMKYTFTILYVKME